MMAGTLSAQTAHSPSDGANRKERQQPGINLSLWKSMATQQADSVGSTCLNLGVFSAMNRLSGAGINLLGSVVYRDMNGMQVTGLANLTGGSMRGIQIAGISNVNGDKLRGISLAGLVGITGNGAQGVILAGLTNIAGDHADGVLVGGLLNIAGKNAAGMHVAGLANLTGEDFGGISLSGLLNLANRDSRGVQISGLGNITGRNTYGLQVAGLGNVTGARFCGMQLAPFNYTRKGKGVQLGLVNYYRESFDGLQLGLVNTHPGTRVQLMLFGGNATKLNAGARFKNDLFYTILGGGTHYLDFGDKFSASLFYRAGLELPLYKQLFVSGDLGFQHIETFRNKDAGIPARLYALQARVNLEYRLNSRLGLFVTGGYGGSRHYGRAATYDKGVIVEGGVVLFQY